LFTGSLEEWAGVGFPPLEIGDEAVERMFLIVWRCFMADLEVQNIEGKAISKDDIEVLEKFYSFRGKRDG
jgi:hypothetical protein